MALTRASSRASLMAKMSGSPNWPARRAASISAWTRRASPRSLAMMISRGRQGVGAVMTTLSSAEKAHRSRPVGFDESERLQPVLFGLVDGEQLVQLGDLEHLVDLRVDVAQDQL